MKKKIIATLLIAATLISQGMTAFAAPESVPDGGYLDPDWYLSAYPELMSEEYRAAYPDLQDAYDYLNDTSDPYHMANVACALYVYHKNHGKDEGRYRVDPGFATPTGNPTATAPRNGFELGGEFSAHSGGGLSSANAIASLKATVTETMPETEIAPGVFRRIVEEYQGYYEDAYSCRYTIEITKDTNVPAPTALAEDVIIAPGCGYPALENVKALHGQTFPRALCDKIQTLSTSKENIGCNPYAVLMQNIVYGRGDSVQAVWKNQTRNCESWVLKRGDWVKGADIQYANSAIGSAGAHYDLDTLPEVQKYDIIKYITDANTMHWAFVLYVDKANNRVLTTEGGGREDFIAATGASNRTGYWVSISDIDAIQRPSNAITIKGLPDIVVKGADADGSY